MKKYLLAIAAVFATFAAPVLADGWPPLVMNEEIEQTNFIVGNHCSGTLVDREERIILTNEHCISNYVTTEKRREPDEKGVIQERTYQVLKPVPVSQKQYSNFEEVSSASYVGEIAAFDDTVDLALIQLRVQNLPHQHEATIFMGESVVRGETVISVGNPMMLDLSVSKGVISSTNRTVKVGGVDLPYYQMDNNITGGSSGGALYNANGELIGVPAAGSRDGVIALAIPIPVIRDFFIEKGFSYLMYEEGYVEPAEEEHTVE